MSHQPPQFDAIGPLLTGLLDGKLDEAQRRELTDLLRDDPAARTHYLEFMLTEAMLKVEFGGTLPSFQRAQVIAADDVRKCVLPESSHSSSSLLPPIIIQTLPSPLSPLPSFVGGPLFSYLVAVIIFGIGLAVGAVMHVSQPADVAQHPASSTDHHPQSPIPSPSPKASVARITGIADCQWTLNGTAYSPLSPLSSPLVALGDRLALRSGLLEITYDTGARVLLQGPVAYEVDSAAGGRLSLGKLTAKLEKRSEVRGQRSEVSGQRSENQKSEIINHQFAVRTPTAVVTDLGTEFGVEVNKSGQTTSHVYRGSVRLQATLPNGTVYGEARVLSANESARVERSGGQGKGTPIIVVGATVKPAPFLREIPRRIARTLDLVDVVAGGDGFSGRRNGGIDPTTGKEVTALDLTSTSPKVSDGEYHRVEGMPFVDGVFIPDGSKAEVQIDSAGHRFDGFKGTRNATWHFIWSAGAMPPDISTRLDGTDLAKPPHRLLFLHASNAITFDLQAIRRANPGCKLLRFLAAAANLEPGEVGEAADIWVLVDGQVRFQRQRVDSYSGVLPVAVRIGEKDRFLTLATTDGGDSIPHDWVIFGDARLELLSVEKQEKREGKE